MVVVPTPALVARPKLLTTATFGADELQLALIRLWVVPSLKCPVALNCCDVPRAILALGGEIVIEVSVAFVIVAVVVPVTEPKVAVMVELPGAKPLIMPV